jgi:hypothetical protein
MGENLETKVKNICDTVINSFVLGAHRRLRVAGESRKTKPHILLAAGLVLGAFMLAGSVSATLPTNPVIAQKGLENYIDAFGTPYVRYRLNVTNSYAFPDSAFVSTSAYGPCGLTTSPSRTWVQIFNASDGSYIYGFCGLSQASQLQDIWFGVPVGGTPYTSVYIELWDRSDNTRYRSNTLTIYTDFNAPSTTDNAPAGWQNADITVTLLPTDTGGSGLKDTFYCVDTSNSCTPSTSGTSVSVTAEGKQTMSGTSQLIMQEILKLLTQQQFKLIRLILSHQIMLQLDGKILMLLLHCLHQIQVDLG